MFPNGLFEVGAQAIQAAGPEAAVEVEPFSGAGEFFRIEAALPMFAVPFVGNQRCVLEHFKVPRDRGQRDLERCGEFADGCVALCQALEDCASGGVGEGGEGLVERGHLSGMLINISVKSREKTDADGFFWA